jgi:signal transduction histidine kinase
LQYTPSNGTITVSNQHDKHEACISVRDTGFGIHSEHLRHIFDCFYRVDKSRSLARGGSGIGLTIARHLVEAHGSKIWVESADKKIGTEFLFKLPCAK